MFTAVTDLYKFFSVSPGCSDEELRSSYRRLLLDSHPDYNPESIESATQRTRQILEAYAGLTEWRLSHPTSLQDLEPVVEEKDDNQVEWTTINVGLGTPFGVSLARIAELQKELHDAWSYFAAHRYDVKAALRLIRAAFLGGRPDFVDDLLVNATLVGAGAILSELYAADEAARVALLWSNRLYDLGNIDFAVQLLEDALSVSTLSTLKAAELKERLRSVHYCAAQGYATNQKKPSPASRISHLRAIIKLGYELGYIYKLLAEALHDAGNDEQARATLENAYAIDPHLSGAKRISRVLGFHVEEIASERPKPQETGYIYKRTEQIPSVSTIIHWLQQDNWDELTPYADACKYSPRLLPSARNSLRVLAAALGECPDDQAVILLNPLLECVYWDVRQSTLLSLAKVGREHEFVRLREYQQKTKGFDQFSIDAVAYAEVRLLGGPIFEKRAELMRRAGKILQSYSYNQYGELGRVRWRLEQVTDIAPNADSIVYLSLLVKLCLLMRDWPRVLKLLTKPNAVVVPDRVQALELSVDLAAAYVQANLQSAALECLMPIYTQLAQHAQVSADKVLWDALHSNEFIGTKNYLWALRKIMERSASASSPDELLPALHRLARVMEPLGEKEMGVWLRHTLREEAPGHYFGDSHDRLRYFRDPVDDPDFVSQIKLTCAEYKPIFKERLRIVLGNSHSIGRSAPQLARGK